MVKRGRKGNRFSRLNYIIFNLLKFNYMFSNNSVVDFDSYVSSRSHRNPVMDSGALMFLHVRTEAFSLGLGAFSWSHHGRTKKTSQHYRLWGNLVPKKTGEINIGYR